MKTKILCLLAIVILISGCTASNLFKRSSTSVGEGVKLEVLHYPTELKQNQAFSFQVRLSNYLTDPVTGRLCLFDSPGSKGVIPNEGECVDVSLAAAEKTERGLLEDQEQIKFPVSQQSYVYTNVEQEFALRTNFFFKFRYDVETKHGATICLGNPGLTDDPCPDQESISLIQPNMPVQITNVKKDLIPTTETEGSLNLQFTLKKVQEGNIVDPQKLYEVGATPREKVRIGIRLGDYSLLCSPIEEDNWIELRENERVINCNTPVIVNTESVQEDLVITLSYGFEQVTELPQLEVKYMGSQRLVR